MTGLLLNIQNAGNQHENVTSDVLAEILNEIPACKEVFLNLFDPRIPKSVNRIEREIGVSLDDEKGRADFLYRGNDCVVVIENKPWEPESSVKGQLSSYGKVMQSWSEQYKYLCLLSVKANRERLLTEIATAENVSVPALEATFLKKNIIFRERTWEQVFDALKKVQPDNMALLLWLKTLEDRIIPQKITLALEDVEEKEKIISEDSWARIENILKGTYTLVKQIGAIYGFRMGDDRNRLVSAGSNHERWWWIYDTANNIWWAICAHLKDWEQLKKDHKRNCIFFMHVHRGKKGNPTVLDNNPEILESLHFHEPYGNGNYFYLPLVDPDDHSETTAEILSTKIVNVLNTVRDLIAFGVK